MTLPRSDLEAPMRNAMMTQQPAEELVWEPKILPPKVSTKVYPMALATSRHWLKVKLPCHPMQNMKIPMRALVGFPMGGESSRSHLTSHSPMMAAA